jgi:hypothetical protein
VGSAGWVAAWLLDARLALYVLVLAAIAYGVSLLAASGIRARNAFTSIIDDLETMSASMRWLALVQFFSWFSLFTIFVYTAPAVAKLHFPGLHPDAARWIVANRRIGAIGIDTASIDYGQSTLFETHRVLYERDVPAFENLTALERLPVTGAHVIALPMKIGGGSGAPLRAIAIVP